MSFNGQNPFEVLRNEQRRQQLAEALENATALNPYQEIEDPVAWPRQQREDRRLSERDCVYCGVEFTPARTSKKTAVSWEHIINDAEIITRENIALCCCGCNASKGQKQLSVWLQSKYCKERNIYPRFCCANSQTGDQKWAVKSRITRQIQPTP